MRNTMIFLLEFFGEFFLRTYSRERISSDWSRNKLNFLRLFHIKNRVTVMLVTSLYWWLIWDIGGRIIMLMIFRYVGDFFNVRNLSPIFALLTTYRYQIGHQHKLSPTSMSPVLFICLHLNCLRKLNLIS